MSDISSIILYLTPLRQGFSLYLEQDWQQPWTFLSLLSLLLTKHWCFWYVQPHSYCGSIKEFNNSLE